MSITAQLSELTQWSLSHFLTTTSFTQKGAEHKRQGRQTLKQNHKQTPCRRATTILPANCDAKRILRHHCHRSCFAANIAAKYQREYEKHERHFRNEYFRPYSQRIFRTRCANFARWNSLRIAIRRKYEPGLRSVPLRL